jgi:hypothetical protein
MGSAGSAALPGRFWTVTDDEDAICFTVYDGKFDADNVAYFFRLEVD